MEGEGLAAVDAAPTAAAAAPTATAAAPTATAAAAAASVARERGSKCQQRCGRCSGRGTARLRRARGETGGNEAAHRCIRLHRCRRLDQGRRTEAAVVARGGAGKGTNRRHHHCSLLHRTCRRCIRDPGCLAAFLRSAVPQPADHLVPCRYRRPASSRPPAAPLIITRSTDTTFLRGTHSQLLVFRPPPPQSPPRPHAHLAGRTPTPCALGYMSRRQRLA